MNIIITRVGNDLIEYHVSDLMIIYLLLKELVNWETTLSVIGWLWMQELAKINESIQ